MQEIIKTPGIMKASSASRPTPFNAILNPLVIDMIAPYPLEKKRPIGSIAVRSGANT